MGILDGLNSAQRDAVENVDGPSLIIAGAGSGKTRVLTHRIVNLLEKGVNPSEILALTFTKKAANEMVARIASLVEDGRASGLWMGTFHSVFSRILRAYADRLGYPDSYSIYTNSDTLSAIKACLKELNLDQDSNYKPKDVYSRISAAKNNLITDSAYSRNAEILVQDNAAKRGRMSEIYALYSKRCKAAGAMDFDDILLNMNILLRDNPDVLEKLRMRFRYILVDEYQDTNYSQYLIIKKLSSFYRNICVVGDDAQSIYSFRGARIKNILDFQKDYQDARVFRLEQNYRSTQTIVNAANSVIARNSMQLKKKCFSEAEKGEKISIMKTQSESDEGFMIASSILDRIYKERVGYSSFAVLYRTNSQSRSIEEALRKRGIPYRIYSGSSFYDRAEVKDMLAYFKLIVNARDDEAFKRIVNFPARGIGETTVGRLAEAAHKAGVSLFEAIDGVPLEAYGIKGAALSKLKAFSSSIRSLRERSEGADAYTLAMDVYSSFGIMAFMQADTSTEGQSRAQNVEELLNSIREFTEARERSAGEDGGMDSVPADGDSVSVQAGSIEDFLENVLLYSDMDRDQEDDGEKVVLMTVHSSKGLEFPYVYIAGMEESLFPSVNSTSTDEDVEEERRLFYVAVTRAEKAVTLSYSVSRFKYGQRMTMKPSRFMKEISPEYRDSIYEDNDDDGGFSGSSFSSGRFGGSGRSGNGEGYGSYGQRGDGFRQSGRYSSSGNYGNCGGGYAGPSGMRQQTVPKPVFQSAGTRAADPDFVPDPVSSLYAGAEIEHDRFGNGVILSMEGSGTGCKAVIRFDASGEKTILLKYAKIRLRK